MTPISRRNSGLFFIEDSHLYGPVSRGPLDPSRFPPMDHICPELAVGDIVLCDYLTWHYSHDSETSDERIMLQLNYQPASDPSSKQLLAGRMPHDKVLTNKFDAASVPSIELNGRAARGWYDEGDLDRATRFARGLLADDPDHAGAALLLFDALYAQNDPAALNHLTTARAILKRLDAQLSNRQALLDGPEAGDPAAEPVWRPLHVHWVSAASQFSDTAALPCRLGTPDAAWAYGAVSDALTPNGPAAIRVKIKAVRGKVALCLINDAQDALLSEQHLIPLDDQVATVFLACDPARGPVRLCLRNFDEADCGEVELEQVDIRLFSGA